MDKYRKSQKVKLVILLILLLVIMFGCKSKKVLEDVKVSEVDTTYVDVDMDGVVDYVDVQLDYVSESKQIFLPEDSNQKKPIPTKSVNSSQVKSIAVEPSINVGYSEGKIAYSVPVKMKLGHLYNVKVRITKDINNTVLVVGDRKIEIGDKDSNIVIEDIIVTNDMSVELISGKGLFEVDTLSSTIQKVMDPIKGLSYTEWAWNIKPLKSGSNKLKIIVKIVIIDKDGNSEPRYITIFDKDVKVQLNVWHVIKSWLYEYWQWLMVIIIIPLIKWLYEEYKKKRIKKD